MSPTPQEYNKMSQKAAPNSKLWRNMLVRVFNRRDLFCTVGQGVMSWMQFPGTGPGRWWSSYLYFFDFFKRAAYGVKLL